MARADVKSVDTYTVQDALARVPSILHRIAPVAAATSPVMAFLCGLWAWSKHWSQGDEPKVAALLLCAGGLMLVSAASLRTVRSHSSSSSFWTLVALTALAGLVTGCAWMSPLTR